MNSKKTVFTVTLTLTLIATIFFVIPVYPQDPPIVPEGTPQYERYGPRVNDIIFSVQGDVLTESESLAAGNIDVMDWTTPGSYVPDWMADSEITLGDYSEWGYYEHDINCQQWPTGHGNMTPPEPSGYTLPPDYHGNHNDSDPDHYWIDYSCQRCLDARQFRRALAHLTDRDAMVANMEGFATAMETFCFPGIASWENPAAQKYAYSLALAEAAFLDGGFADWDTDGTMEYSPSHGAVADDEEDLPTLMGWIRSDDPDRTFAGIQLRDDLLKLGVPLDMPVADRSTCYYHAWVLYDYHIYTGGWSMGRVPDMYCDLWYSEKDWYPDSGADNYNRYHSQEYDVQAWGLKTASTPAEAKVFSDACQIILHRDVACIPTYTYSGYLSHRTNYGSHPGEAVYAGLEWEGFCNELGYAFYSGWNPINVHPQGFSKGGTLRHGLLVDIEKYSPVHAEWFYDWLILQQIYECLIYYHPLDATKYVPIMCPELPTQLTWTLDGETCTRLRYKPYENMLWHDLTPVTLLDIGFSYGYMKAEFSVANYYTVQNYHGFLTTANGSNPGVWGDATPPGHIDILYDVESWLAMDWASASPIIPKHIWEDKDSSTWNPEDHGGIIGTGPFQTRGGHGTPTEHQGEVGWPDHELGQYVHLEANPNYYLRYVWPDVCDVGGAVGRDEFVGSFDWGAVSLSPGHIFTNDPRLYPDLPAWPEAWIVDGDQLLDVTKDGRINAADLTELGIWFLQDFPPAYYLAIP
jgi:hypothetical protein